jgi:hypothetical protein
MARKRYRIPKRVAGIKVPKALRRGRIGEFVASPMGQAIIVESVVRAGEELMRRDQDEVPRDAAAPSEARLGGLGDPSDTGVLLAHAFREAGRAFVTALREGGAIQPDRDVAELEKRPGAVRRDQPTAH